MDSRTTAWRRWAVLATVLALLSLAVQPLIHPSMGLPSALRDPLERFIGAGVGLWWMTLGGPFRDHPSDVLGMLVVAVGNAAILCALWWLLLRAGQALRAAAGKWRA